MSILQVEPAMLRECQVVNLWQHRCYGGADMATDNGEPLRVVYPGRLNDDRGADFRDAVIFADGQMVKGEVEVHVRSSSWQAHRHHEDPAYNNVILHVVMWRDSPAATVLSNGKEVPTLVLSESWERYSGSGMPCREADASLTWEAISRVLDDAGRERFLAKSDNFLVEMDQIDGGQSLYQGVMGALGYSKNKEPCLELARRLPLNILEAIAQANSPKEECLYQLQALLMGSAGLLPSQRFPEYQRNNSDDPRVARLEGYWANNPNPAAMSGREWRIFKVRPGNFPVRRIAAMSYLLLRYREGGLLEGITRLVDKASIEEEHRKLEAGFIVTDDGYWSGHYDFGPGRKLTKTALLGGNRAAGIAINILLPFTSAWGRFTSQTGLEEKALDLYGSYPGTAENSVVRHMKNQLGLKGKSHLTARQEQGLIHIYDTLCTQGRCNRCQLNYRKG